MPAADKDQLTVNADSDQLTADSELRCIHTRVEKYSETDSNDERHHWYQYKSIEYPSTPSLGGGLLFFRTRIVLPATTP